MHCTPLQQVWLTGRKAAGTVVVPLARSLALIIPRLFVGLHASPREYNLQSPLDVYATCAYQIGALTHPLFFSLYHHTEHALSNHLSFESHQKQNNNAAACCHHESPFWRRSLNYILHVPKQKRSHQHNLTICRFRLDKIQLYLTVLCQDKCQKCCFCQF